MTRKVGVLDVKDLSFGTIFIVIFFFVIVSFDEILNLDLCLWDPKKPIDIDTVLVFLYDSDIIFPEAWKP